MASTSALSAAIRPNTPAATDSGRTARSPWPSTTDVTRNTSGIPGGSNLLNSRCTAATSRSPRASRRPVQRLGGTAAEFLPGERRGCQYPVDVVLDDLVGEHADAGNRQPDAVHWLPGHGIKARVACLLCRVEVDGERLADAEAEAACRLLADDYLAWPPGIGALTSGDDDAVLVEVEAVERADQFHLLVEQRLRISESRSQGAQAGEGHIRFGRPYPRQMRDLADHPGAVRAGIHVEVGRVTRGEDPREGRLRPAGSGRTGHGHPADESHDQCDRQVPAPVCHPSRWMGTNGAFGVRRGGRDGWGLRGGGGGRQGGHDGMGTARPAQVRCLTGRAV
jgi:hypothetical protein